MSHAMCVIFCKKKSTARSYSGVCGQRRRCVWVWGVGVSVKCEYEIVSQGWSIQVVRLRNQVEDYILCWQGLSSHWVSVHSFNQNQSRYSHVCKRPMTSLLTLWIYTIKGSLFVSAHIFYARPFSCMAIWRFSQHTTGSLGADLITFIFLSQVSSSCSRVLPDWGRYQPSVEFWPPCEEMSWPAFFAWLLYHEIFRCASMCGLLAHVHIAPA